MDLVLIVGYVPAAIGQLCHLVGAKLTKLPLTFLQSRLQLFTGSSEQDLSYHKA